MIALASVCYWLRATKLLLRIVNSGLLSTASTGRKAVISQIFQSQKQMAWKLQYFGLFIHYTSQFSGSCWLQSNTKDFSATRNNFHIWIQTKIKHLSYYSPYLISHPSVRRKLRTLHAILCEQSFPNPSGGLIFLSSVTTSVCLMKPLASGSYSDHACTNSSKWWAPNIDQSLHHAMKDSILNW